MASLQTLHLNHLPPSLAVHIALYTSLQNAPFLRDQLLQGNPDFEYALIDASVILSPTHLLAAIFRAANDYLNGRLKSRNVHSEIVFSLGANNNIARSLRTFGIAPMTQDLVVVKLATDASISRESVADHLRSSIEGTPVDFTDEMLGGITDVAKVRKLYKLPVLGEGRGKSKRRRKDGSEEGSGGNIDAGKGAEWERKELEVAILGLMALRGAV